MVQSAYRIEDRLIPKGSEVSKLLYIHDLIIEVETFSREYKSNNHKVLLARINTRKWNEINSKYIIVDLDKSDKEIQEYLIKQIKIFLTEQLLET